MSKFVLRPWRRSFLSGFALVLAGGTPAFASTSDYRFELVRLVEAHGRGSAVTVALIHTPTGRRVTDADVFRREMLMREKGPVRIDEKHSTLSPDGQGNYRLTTYYPLSEGTMLKLGARVAGEAGTVRSSVRLDAQK